jgi:hypothetical protein
MLKNVWQFTGVLVNGLIDVVGLLVMSDPRPPEYESSHYVTKEVTK